MRPISALFLFLGLAVAGGAIGFLASLGQSFDEEQKAVFSGVGLGLGLGMAVVAVVSNRLD